MAVSRKARGAVPRVASAPPFPGLVPGLAFVIERRTIIKLRNEDVISDEVLRRIQRDIDLAEALGALNIRAPNCPT